MVEDANRAIGYDLVRGGHLAESSEALRWYGPRVPPQLAAIGLVTKTEPWDAFWGQRYAQALDPDGNTVDLFRPL